MSGGRNSFSMTVDTSGLDEMLEIMGERSEEAVRPAAQAMAQVFYDEVKRNVAKLGRVTGNLESAIYQAFSNDRSGEGRATYHISWNHRKAPHGHLVEFGYMQRYKMYRDSEGRIRPMVRPGMDGQSPPSRRASQAEKDAYYVPLPGGPRHVGARAFVRNAFNERVKQAAIHAAEGELLKRLFGGGEWS